MCGVKEAKRLCRLRLQTQPVLSYEVNLGVPLEEAQEVPVESKKATRMQDTQDQVAF